MGRHGSAPRLRSARVRPFAPGTRQELPAAGRSCRVGAWALRIKSLILRIYFVGAWLAELVPTVPCARHGNAVGEQVMGIFGALTTAVTGMRAQSYALENVSGNIAISQ